MMGQYEEERMSGLRRSDLIAAIDDAESTLRRLKMMLEVYDNSSTSLVDRSPYKNEANRLTELGRQEVKRLMKSGKTDSEIARIVGITPAAVARYR
jgi:DNA-binding NarL/FixJ family response regulator